VTFKSFLILTALLLSHAAALSQNLPDAPSVTANSSPAPQGDSMARAEKHWGSSAAPAARRPWIDPYVADFAYWDSTFALVGTTVLNVEMTARCSERGTCLTWIASGSAAGSTHLRLYAYTLPADAAFSYLAYRLKPKHKWWMVPNALVTAANLFSAGRSYGRLQVASPTTK
jgi:hypothetical protein